MPRYEGLVASLKENGMAEVLIQPGSPGIPGASADVNERVCHCVTDASTVAVQAANRAGAGVGDYVSIIRSPGAILKNAATLIGIPLIGLISGMALAFLFTNGFVVHVAGGLLIIGAGLLTGIIIAAVLFRGNFAADQAVIEHIIKAQKEVASLIGQNKCPVQQKSPSCEGCKGLF